ncbi:MAG: molybdate ABC transporter substrate-binding protein [Alphaproteobacteria bacterium]|nr:molybdate ABC transporter substrate-binding protein [Alphaproteobacteria bacterium]
MIDRRSLSRGLAVSLAALVLAVVAASTPAAAAGRLTVFAAASLKTALDEVRAVWMADTGKEVTISYAASSALARQIEQGAPADIFISADLDWMNYLTDRNLVRLDGVIRLLGNEIVLIAPRESKAETTIAKGFPLVSLLGGGRLAMGDVKAVPAGKYGKQALETLGVWGSVKSRIAQAENVRAALKLVATGEAPLGIVYQTDAAAEPAVRIIGVFPAYSHNPIVYPAGPVAASSNPDAAAFLTYLQSPKARNLFGTQGFTSPAPAATN